MLATVLISSFIVFGSMFLSPEPRIAFLLGTDSGDATKAEIRAITAEYHLNSPFFVQYVDWLGQMLRGNLGFSDVYRTSVWSLLEPRLTITISLVCYAAILMIIWGVVGGALAALRGRVFNYLFDLGTTVGFATPSFVAAIILVTIFALHLHWFPAEGVGQGLWERVRSLTLPAVALALTASSVVARITRVSMRSEARKEHVETAICRGIPQRTVTTHHILRNALVPITTVVGLNIASLLIGTVVVETAFGLNGVGSFLVQSVEQKDFAVVQAISLLFVVTFVVLNALADSLYSVFDPRIRKAVKAQ